MLQNETFTSDEPTHFADPYKHLGLHNLYGNFGGTVANALHNDAVSEIMLNSDGKLFLEQANGAMELAGSLAPHEANGVIRILASLLHKRLDVQSPILSGEIPENGARFEGLLPPLVEAPSFSIRRHTPLALPLTSLLQKSGSSNLCHKLLIKAIANHKNILISGATGTGKTTLMNSLLYEINTLFPDERIVTLEDTKELKVSSPNHLNLFTSETTDMGQLLRSALRLRPDRIVVGEVRGAEALDLIDALSTGHNGGLTTVHAGSVEQALSRLSLLVSRHPAAPQHKEELIADALNLIVQLERTPLRHIATIASVKGFKDGRFQLKTLFSAEKATEKQGANEDKQAINLIDIAKEFSEQ